MEHNNDERHLTRQNHQQPAQMWNMEVANNGEMSASIPPALSALGLGKTSIYLETHPEYLTASLHHSDWTIRAAAVQVLGKRSVSVEPLLNALHDENVSVRATATRALGMQGPQAPVEPLVAALQDREWRVRTAAAQALGRLKNRTPIEPLLPVLHDENASVRAAAVWALGTLGERAPIENLVFALQDKAWAVREAAAMALQEQGERAPIAPLLAARWDEDSSVREAIETTLSQRLNEQEGQKIVPLSTNQQSTSWFRLVLAVLSVGILIPLAGLLTFNNYTGGFGFASELAAVVVVCIAIALINTLYQRKSTTVLSPQKHLQATGETASWHNLVLAGASLLTLVKITFDILNPDIGYTYAPTLNMVHFILIARLIALGVIAATVIVINRVFFRRH